MESRPGAIKHILFDNDGTIVDSEILAVRIMLRHLSEYGFEMSEQEYSRRFPGLRDRDILAVLQQEYGLELPADFIPRLHTEHTRAFDRELRVVPGMYGLFRSLQTAKSMVSNGSINHVERSLQRVRLRGFLEGRIFSAEQVERPKPFPDIYHFALRELNLKPEEVIVVEDSPTGVEAAKSAGLFVVGFLAASHVGQGHGTTLKAHGADVLATNVGSLKNIFASLYIV